MMRQGKSKSSIRRWNLRVRAFHWLLLLLAPIGLSAHAQGILTITPGRGVTTSAGTGAVGYTGDNGPAAAATLASPSAVAYDVNGNLYLADAQNHVVREVSKAGTITTVAGTGVEGFSGDGGAATSAQLDTPTGVAVDKNGNIFIADSRNNRIREVSGGTITTVAGTGSPSFGGDNAAAIAAGLWLPSAVAIDTSGNLYIADTNNQRIRKITGTTISTIAGNGDELYAGDGGAATAASLDSPTGVAVDAGGKVYIADRHNQRVRVVDAGGNISTLAGSGAVTFAGGFSGDGSGATAASLAKPSGVSVDAAGNVYVADTNNQRIRQIGGGAIATIAGTGDQGFGGDGGPATGAILNSPKSVALDAAGNFAIADKLNERIRATSLALLTFANDGVGVPSAAQGVTLANTGSASLSVSSIAFTGAFTAVAGGSCASVPVTLAAGASCTQNVAFLPVAPGAATGSVVFSGTGVVPQTVLLAGTGVQSATTVTLSSNNVAPFAAQPVTFTAVVKPAGAGTATGTMSFFDGPTLLGSVQTLVAGSASVTVTLTAGTHSITAVYSGDTNFSAGTSTVLSQFVADFSFTLLSSGGSSSQTVTPGQTATYSFTVAPIGGPFNFPVTLSATGLPPGATVTFTPPVITVGASPANFTMTIQTAKTTAALRRTGLFGGGAMMAGLLLLPFTRRMRRRARRIRPLNLCALLLLGLGALGGLAGCGTGSGFFGESQHTYTINVIGTATGANGLTLQHVATVTLTVE
ncbi:MAG TPA: Ig-like domain repeat protein [Acidobacteriaceae bacterium]